MSTAKVKRKFTPIELKEGMTVTIRQWDDMEEEFGLDSRGAILTFKYCFPEEMREFCGTKVRISEVSYGRRFSHRGFTITQQMLEECYKPIRQLPDHLKGKI